MFENDKLTEECGILAVSSENNREIVKTAYYGLNALQHRGQVSCGLAVSNDEAISCYKDYGLVTDVFNESILSLLKGRLCIGHVSQDQNSTIFTNNAQPFVVNYSKGSLAVAFNGGIRNKSIVKKHLESKGAVFTSTSTSEIAAHLLIQNSKDGIVNALRKLREVFVGGYCICILTKDSIYAMRDSFSIRPLCLGKLDDGYVIASESCAIDLVGGEFVRDLKSSEIIKIKDNKIQSFDASDKRKSCVFEYIYFSRPDSTIDSINVYKARESSGVILAKNHPCDADIVVGVPDSGTPSALGYARQSKIPYCQALIKNKYIGRTFVENSDNKRDVSLRIKLNPIKRLIEGKSVVLVDDSIVRGSTMKKLIKNFRDCGAKKVHVRITCPPVYNSCDFGVIVPSGKSLIANTIPLKDMAKHLGADSLEFLSIDGLKEAIGKDFNICTGCLDNSYPIFSSVKTRVLQGEKSELVNI